MTPLKKGAISQFYVDKVLQRVFQEHFQVKETGLRPKSGKELQASNLQSPDDLEATYRKKRGEKHQVYIANVTETGPPENKRQLIVKVQTESNNTDAAKRLNDTLPELKERTDMDTLYTDDGYNSPDVDQTMRELEVEQVQTAIRGRKPSAEKLSLDDFVWELDDEGCPEAVTCPHKQKVKVKPGRQPNRYRAVFNAPDCANCPLLGSCPTKPLNALLSGGCFFRSKISTWPCVANEVLKHGLVGKIHVPRLKPRFVLSNPPLMVRCRYAASSAWVWSCLLQPL